MAAPGRPIERPAHLSPEQRTRAQKRTQEWRQQCGLSQRDMAAAVGVSPALYRTWETGRDDHAGPTRAQTELLDRVLRERLRDGYAEGEAFDVWGWPRQQDMSYDRVVELLRQAGFDVPRLTASGQPPAGVFWVHRAREPNLVHGVFSLAAAAATRAGVPVYLLLDDLERSDRQNQDLCEQLDSRIRTWVAFASGDGGKLSTRLYSEVLTEPHLAGRGWSAINDYLNPRVGVLDFLVASKVISPLLYTINPEESVLDLLRNAESLGAQRLLTPLRNWLVFEQQIGWVLGRSGDAATFVVTLGGEDERALWEAFHRGCSEDLSARLRHIYLRPIPMPSYRSPWQYRALSAGTSRSTLTTYLVNRTPSDGGDLLEWLLKAAIRLPAALNPGFREGLEPVLQDVDALLRTPVSGLPTATVGSIAKAVVEWLDV
jgi:transcriptional regulator with XRE-family HTH domain